MNLKKLTALAVILVLLLSTAALAASDGCIISAETVSGKPGTEVSVAITVSGGTELTNFGIALDYDSSRLELVRIDLTDGNGTPVLLPTAAQNLRWDPARDKNAQNNPAFDRSRTYPYLTAAAMAPVAGNGTVFTAVFRVKPGASGTAAVTPIVNYVRKDTQALQVCVRSGGVTLPEPSKPESALTPAELAAAADAYNRSEPLTPAQLEKFDLNRDGLFTLGDLMGLAKQN